MSSVRFRSPAFKNMIKDLFPTPVYETFLEPTKEVQDTMIHYVHDFLEKNQEHFANVPSLTGEVLGDYQISDKPEFKWLSEQVFSHCSKYIEEIGATMEHSELWAVQSWPVVCVTNSYVGYHRHSQSHFSAVYYVQCDDDCESGELVIHAHEPNPLSNLPIYHEKSTVHNRRRDLILPKKGKLVIFPSVLAHEVLPYYGDLPRFSVSFDIMVTSKKDAGSFCLVHPSKWVKLS